MKIYLLLVLTTLLGSCTKGFLDTKPRSDITQPASLSDLAKMLETDGLALTPALPVLSADEYYYPGLSNWQMVTATEQSAYTWNKDVFGGQGLRLDWMQPYNGIFYANNVLESLVAMDSAAAPEGKKIRGWALFIRAYNYYNLVKNFAPLYNTATAASDLGVPLKLTAPIETLPRSSVQAVYNQVLQDLKEARELLPAELPANRNRPCLMAVDALLARIGLTMQDYVMAEKFADSCLYHYKVLMNYNNGYSTSSSQPFRANNEETLFATTIVQTYTASRVGGSTVIAADSVLLKMYNANDMRSLLFFGKISGQTVIKRGYFGAGISFPFTGLATDEVYLVKAECAARRNAIDTCLHYLNALLVNRYKPGTFTDLTAATGQEALALALLERRKELVWRGLRWDDLARLNKEAKASGGTGVFLTRVLDGQTYTLSPNSSKYIFNIPADEIALSGIQQNERD